MSTKSFRYGPKWTSGAVGSAFGLVIIWATLSAFRSPAALASSSLGQMLGPGLATSFALVAGIGGLLLLAISLHVLQVALRGSRAIVFGNTQFEFPHGKLFTKTTKVPYTSVISIRVEPLANKRALQIRCADRSIFVVESMLPEANAFDELVSQLEARTGVRVQQ